MRRDEEIDDALYRSSPAARAEDLAVSLHAAACFGITVSVPKEGVPAPYDALVACPGHLLMRYSGPTIADLKKASEAFTQRVEGIIADEKRRALSASQTLATLPDPSRTLTPAMDLCNIGHQITTMRQTSVVSRETKFQSGIAGVTVALYTPRPALHGLFFVRGSPAAQRDLQAALQSCFAQLKEAVLVDLSKSYAEIIQKL